MRFSAVTLLVCCVVLVRAQSTPHTLLWSVTPPMGHPSYLYGTFHSRDARVFQFQDSVLIALGSCSMVAGELDVNEAKKLDATVMNAMLLPSGGSLDRLYNKHDYRLVIGGLKERLGHLAPLCTKLRPYYTVTMLMESGLGSDSAVVLDAWFQRKAEQLGKKVVGLETLSEQLAAVEKIPLREQARLLYEVIAQDTTVNRVDEGLRVYLARDLDALMSLVERDGLPEHSDKALLEDRNARMADRMAQYMAKGNRVFTAIGAAHLAGTKGMIAELRARGFEVEPVAPSMIAPVTPPEAPCRPALLPPAIALKKGVHVRNDTLGYAVDMPRPPVKQVIQENDSLQVFTWTSTSADGQFVVSVTTSEGVSVTRTDPRSRIELAREMDPGPKGSTEALTRIDGAQALVRTPDPGSADQIRLITVATPLRTHVFSIALQRERSSSLVDQVVRSIRIMEVGVLD